MNDEPQIRFADAKAYCATVYPNRAEALAVGRRLHTTGWLIPLLGASDCPPSDQAGTRVLATVFHPTTLTSPGTLTYCATDTPHPLDAAMSPQRARQMGQRHAGQVKAHDR